MACHIVDPVFKALKLGYPTSVEASASVFVENWQPVDNLGSAPSSSLIRFDFPARPDMPPVKVTWYDGGLLPPRPDELEDDEMMGDGGGGCLFVGTEGKIMCETYGYNPSLLPTSRMDGFVPPPKQLARVEGEMRARQRVWVDACKGGPVCSSNFDYAGPRTEMILIGNLALRSFMLPETHKDAAGREMRRYSGRIKLQWDGAEMRVANYDAANQFVQRTYREGYSL